MWKEAAEFVGSAAFVFDLLFKHRLLAFVGFVEFQNRIVEALGICLLYTSDAADE